jgi:glycosyltransferase involved in cell wall biosynthesis
MLSNLFLSIAVTSYSRVDELERCLLSIDSSLISDVEIIISEDCSPKKTEIRSLVEKIALTSQFVIKFNSNEKNIGYDRNIKKLIDMASGEYILFITDDDKFSQGALDKLIRQLKKNSPGFLLTPFRHVKSGLVQRKYSNSHHIACGLKSVNKYLFDNILVSGLVFKRSLIPAYEETKLDKLIYTQVYIFCVIALRNEGEYLDVELIECIEDGENAYGKSPSNLNKDLADRSKPISNLEFNKGLIQIVRMFDEDYNSSAHKRFSQEYSFRSWTGLSESKRISQNEMKNYFEKLAVLDIEYNFFPYIYFGFLTLFGYSFSQVIVAFPKYAVKKIRSLMSFW